jgi:hypothetical protein
MRSTIWPLAVVTLAVILATARQGGTSVQAHGAPGRYGEPIVLTGEDLAEFAGAPKSQLWAFALDHGEWERVHVQMDERSSGGRVVAAEDGLLDSNDEVVFMSDLVGQRRSAEDWPPGIAREHPAAEVLITDPDNPSWEGCVYIFWSTVGPENALVPRVTWDPATNELSSAAYTLGFADSGPDGFSGIKTLKLFNGPNDILDRLKVRVNATFLGMPTTITEESDEATIPAPEAVSTGPVRVVLDTSGEMAAYERRVRLGSGLSDIPSLPGVITVNDAMVALDFLPSAGPGTYKDANTAGVPIDGVADAVAASPWSPWRSVEFADGRLVLLNKPAGVQNHYTDGSFEGDTGDGVAHGQTGVFATGTDALVAAEFPGELVMVGPGQTFEGGTLYSQAVAPLVAEVMFNVVPTATGPTPTPSETWTPTQTVPAATTQPPSATPTREATPEGGASLFLPRVITHRQGR